MSSYMCDPPPPLPSNPIYPTVAAAATNHHLLTLVGGPADFPYRRGSLRRCPWMQCQDQGMVSHRSLPRTPGCHQLAIPQDAPFFVCVCLRVGDRSNVRAVRTMCIIMATCFSCRACDAPVPCSPRRRAQYKVQLLSPHHTIQFKSSRYMYVVYPPCAKTKRA